MECLALYSDDGAKFMAIFNPSLQGACLKHPQRAFLGTAPALGTVRQAYGDNTADSWLAVELFDLAKASGAKDAHSHREYIPMAELLGAEFGHLKVTELLYFFGKCKTGRHGKFYGNIDFMAIGEALRDFCAGERMTLLREFRSMEERERREAEAAEPTVSISDTLAKYGVSSLMELIAKNS